MSLEEIKAYVEEHDNTIEFEDLRDAKASHTKYA